MSRFNIIDLWNERYPGKTEVSDYAGRLIKKSACSNPNSSFHPTLDHIRPLSDGGEDIKENIEICHRLTNEEKADRFPHWKANGKRFHARKRKNCPNGYQIIKDN